MSLDKKIKKLVYLIDFRVMYLTFSLLSLSFWYNGVDSVDIEIGISLLTSTLINWTCWKSVGDLLLSFVKVCHEEKPVLDSVKTLIEALNTVQIQVFVKIAPHLVIRS